LEESKKSKSSVLTDSGRKAASWSSSSDDRPFSQLLKGVVLAISGIANPDRANLRQMALSMGAQYVLFFFFFCLSPYYLIRPPGIGLIGGLTRHTWLRFFLTQIRCEPLTRRTRLWYRASG
jgi:hypothetical protein